MSDLSPFPFSDLELARRLEGTEGRTNAEFVRLRAELFPDSGATWIEVAGAFAMYDGLTSPITQTFGLGLFDPVTDVELDRVEAFFRERGAQIHHETSPVADPELFKRLRERRYEPFEFTSVLYRPVDPEVRLDASINERIRVRVVGEEEADVWAQTAIQGWSASGDLSRLLNDAGRIFSKSASAFLFLAELDEKPIAVAALNICDGMALMAGASTIPEARRQGGQLALLESRLRYAAEQGCSLAMMGALPGSASQRNAERHGFRIAYTRIKWRLPQG
jgi:GNAT superfamily N-acetyltransferase